MRRLLVAAVSGAVLLLGAGCSTDKTDDTAATPTAGPVPAPVAPGASAAAPATGASGGPAATGGSGGPAGSGDAALARNTDAICDQATRVSRDAVAGFAADVKLLEKAKRSDEPATVTQAGTQAQRRLEGWAYALRDLSGLTADNGLKASFGGLSGKVEKLSRSEDLTKVSAGQLSAISGDVKKACSAA